MLNRISVAVTSVFPVMVNAIGCANAGTVANATAVASDANFKLNFKFYSPPQESGTKGRPFAHYCNVVDLRLFRKVFPGTRGCFLCLENCTGAYRFALCLIPHIPLWLKQLPPCNTHRECSRIRLTSNNEEAYATSARRSLCRRRLSDPLSGLAGRELGRRARQVSALAYLPKSVPHPEADST